jgi:hypothetical protein
LKNLIDQESYFYKDFPLFIINENLDKSVYEIGGIQIGFENPSIYLIGDVDKILKYNVDSDKWELIINK